MLRTIVTWTLLRSLADGLAVSRQAVTPSSDPRLVTLGADRYAARVAYDGTAFRGWQYQPGARTVQGCVDDALNEALRCPPGSGVKSVAASRTDTGVHARGQAIHFDAAAGAFRNPAQFQNRVNRLLPPEIKLWNLSRAPAAGTVDGLPWHANIAPTGKLYSYRFRMADTMDPLDRIDRALWYREKLDVECMATACKCFEGTHDFSSFANRLGHKSASSTTPVNPVRTIRSVKLVEEMAGLDYRIDFVLDGALYKMVRNVMGVLFNVGSGEAEISDIEKIFALQDRTKNLNRAAPAEGLTLEHVFYDDF